MKKIIILLLFFSTSQLWAKKNSCCEYQVKECCVKNPHKDKLYKVALITFLKVITLARDSRAIMTHFGMAGRVIMNMATLITAAAA